MAYTFVGSIRLGYKCLASTNALAYFAAILLTTVGLDTRTVHRYLSAHLDRQLKTKLENKNIINKFNYRL
jgi:hypothetical protein